MKYKNFTKFDFKKFHPSGTLSIKLKTVEDLMITGRKMPVVNENTKMEKALKIIENKKLGVLLIKNKKNQTTGIITDGDLKRIARKFSNFENLKLKKVMKKSPLSIKKDNFANALSIMNSKKITSLCVHEKNNIKNYRFSAYA